MRFYVLGMTLFLAACQGPPHLRAAPDLRVELYPKTGPMPPEGPPGNCWGSDTTPAVIDTYTKHVLLRPEKRDAAGQLVSPAIFRTEIKQEIVQDRREVWFRAPCPADMTQDFVATVQRALKARGLYLAPLTGQFDAPTRHAIRQFQAPLGLDSEQLSLAAARSLGILPGVF
jgi:hypothetical protein